MGTFTKARTGSTRAEIVNFFLALGKTDVVTLGTVAWQLPTSTTMKTVRNVLATLVAENALRRTSNGYKVRSYRALNSILGS